VTTRQRVHESDESERITLIIYQELKQRIIDGEYIPNEKFNQSKIAKEYNVSRTPVVKALSLLEADGIVDNVPQKGYFVHVLSVRDLDESYALKIALETSMAESVVKYASKEDIAELKEMFAPFDIQQDVINEKAYEQADRQFHGKLILLSRNSLMIKIYHSINLSFRNYQAGLFRAPKDTLPEHHAIIREIESGNVDSARELLNEHTLITKRKIEKFMNNLIEMGIDPSEFPIHSIHGMKR